MNSKIGKVLRTVAIILLGLTAVMNLTGGIGTTCAAFGLKPEYRIAFQELQDYLWLYQIIVITTILIGITDFWALTRLARKRQNGFRDALIVLVVGTLLGAIHFYASQTLRGAAAPANVKFYINAFTLFIFLVLWLPAIRQHVDVTAPDASMDGATAGGLSAIVAGIVVFSVPIWAGQSHTLNGENWVNVLFAQLETAGGAVVIGGFVLLGWVGLSLVRDALAQSSRSQSVPKSI